MIYSWTASIASVYMIKPFAKAVNDWKLATAFAKSYIIDIWQGLK